MKVAFATVVALFLCTGVALAQENQPNQGSGSTSNSASPTTTATTSKMSVRQQIKDNLQKDGYQDISVLPASFIVHAKDKNGHTTAMVIAPDSTFIVTEDAAGNTKGSSASAPQGGQQ